MWPETQWPECWRRASGFLPARICQEAPFGKEGTDGELEHLTVFREDFFPFFLPQYFIKENSKCTETLRKLYSERHRVSTLSYYTCYSPSTEPGFFADTFQSCDIITPQWHCPLHIFSQSQYLLHFDEMTLRRVKHKHLKCRCELVWAESGVAPDSSQDAGHHCHPRKVMSASSKRPPHRQVTDVLFIPCCRSVLTVLEFIQWNHAGCTLLCKTWHLSASIRRYFSPFFFSFFLFQLPRSIPLYKYTTVYPFSCDGTWGLFPGNGC